MLSPSTRRLRRTPGSGGSSSRPGSRSKSLASRARKSGPKSGGKRVENPERRRNGRRPGWDDSLGDTGRYRLSEKDLLKKKLQLMSRHNPLAKTEATKLLQKAKLTEEEAEAVKAGTPLAARSKVRSSRSLSHTRTRSAGSARRTATKAAVGQPTPSPASGLAGSSSGKAMPSSRRRASTPPSTRHAQETVTRRLAYSPPSGGAGTSSDASTVSAGRSRSASASRSASRSASKSPDMRAASTPTCGEDDSPTAPSSRERVEQRMQHMSREEIKAVVQSVHPNPGMFLDAISDEVRAFRLRMVARASKSPNQRWSASPAGASPTGKASPQSAVSANSRQAAVDAAMSTTERTVVPSLQQDADSDTASQDGSNERMETSRLEEAVQEFEARMEAMGSDPMMEAFRKYGDALPDVIMAAGIGMSGHDAHAHAVWDSDRPSSFAAPPEVAETITSAPLLAVKPTVEAAAEAEAKTKAQHSAPDLSMSSQDFLAMEAAARRDVANGAVKDRASWLQHGLGRPAPGGEAAVDQQSEAAAAADDDGGDSGDDSGDDDGDLWAPRMPAGLQAHTTTRGDAASVASVDTDGAQHNGSFGASFTADSSSPQQPQAMNKSPLMFADALPFAAAAQTHTQRMMSLPPPPLPVGLVAPAFGGQSGVRLSADVDEEPRVQSPPMPAMLPSAEAASSLWETASPPVVGTTSPLPLSCSGTPSAVPAAALHSRAVFTGTRIAKSPTIASVGSSGTGAGAGAGAPAGRSPLAWFASLKQRAASSGTPPRVGSAAAAGSSSLTPSTGPSSASSGSTARKLFGSPVSGRSVTPSNGAAVRVLRSPLEGSAPRSGTASSRPKMVGDAAGHQAVSRVLFSRQ